METDRVKFEIIKENYTQDLRELFCQNEVVMKTTLKGRVFKEGEFSKLLDEEFCKSEDDTFGFISI